MHHCDILAGMRKSLPVLLDQLPAMQCDKGCTDCCTIVPASDREIAAIRDYATARGILPQQRGPLSIRCPFFQEGRCAVYPVRPMICRLFGHSPRLVCKHGYNVNVNPAIERRIKRLHKRHGPCKMLHDVFSGSLLDAGHPRI